MVKLSELRPNDLLRADGGFTCIPAGAILVVKHQNGALGVPCNCGFHNLEGQVSYDDWDTLVGFTRA